MGKNITRVGENGDGQTGGQPDHRRAEHPGGRRGLLFAARNGADPAKVREALMGGFAGSKILEVHGERMIKGTFDPGFRISLHQKDLNLALAGARELGLNLPNTANAQQVFSTCAAIGGSGWDHSALIKGLEHMANFSIRRSKAFEHAAMGQRPHLQGQTDRVVGHRNARAARSRAGPEVRQVGIIASPTTSMTCASQPDRRHQTAPFRFARHKESRPDCRAGRFMQTLALALASPKVWNRCRPHTRSFR